jgi:uncharacterized alpha/beta hydrolase family protein
LAWQKFETPTIKKLGGQMKKIFFLLAIASFGIFALASCGSTTEKTNTAATQNTAEKTNTTATKNEEPAKNNLKPGDVSPDKAVKVIELVDSVAADKDAWKGKEVAVTGYVSGTSGSGNHQLLTLTNEQTATNKKSITCAFQGDKPDALFAKTVEVKGKISFVNTDGEYKTVNLEPCELKK